MNSVDTDPMKIAALRIEKPSGPFFYDVVVGVPNQYAVTNLRDRWQIGFDKMLVVP